MGCGQVPNIPCSRPRTYRPTRDRLTNHGLRCLQLAALGCTPSVCLRRVVVQLQSLVTQASVQTSLTLQTLRPSEISRLDCQCNQCQPVHRTIHDRIHANCKWTELDKDVDAIMIAQSICHILWCITRNIQLYIISQQTPCSLTTIRSIHHRQRSSPMKNEYNFGTLRTEV